MDAFSPVSSTGLGLYLDAATNLAPRHERCKKFLLISVRWCIWRSLVCSDQTCRNSSSNGEKCRYISSPQRKPWMVGEINYWLDEDIRTAKWSKVERWMNDGKCLLSHYQWIMAFAAPSKCKEIQIRWGDCLIMETLPAYRNPIKRKPPVDWHCSENRWSYQHK